MPQEEGGVHHISADFFLESLIVHYPMGRAQGERSGVRGAPTSRRAGRFVVVHSASVDEDKMQGYEPAYAIVVAMMLL